MLTEINVKGVLRHFENCANFCKQLYLSSDGRLGAVGAREGEVNGPDPDHEAHAAL